MQPAARYEGAVGCRVRQGKAEHRSAAQRTAKIFGKGEALYRSSLKEGFRAAQSNAVQSTATQSTAKIFGKGETFYRSSLKEGFKGGALQGRA